MFSITQQFCAIAWIQLLLSQLKRRVSIIFGENSLKHWLPTQNQYRIMWEPLFFLLFFFYIFFFKEYVRHQSRVFFLTNIFLILIFLLLIFFEKMADKILFCFFLQKWWWLLSFVHNLLGIFQTIYIYIYLCYLYRCFTANKETLLPAITGICIYFIIMATSPNIGDKINFTN